jgi:hypothetical protein
MQDPNHKYEVSCLIIAAVAILQSIFYSQCFLCLIFSLFFAFATLLMYSFIIGFICLCRHSAHVAITFFPFAAFYLFLLLLYYAVLLSALFVSAAILPSCYLFFPFAAFVSAAPILYCHQFYLPLPPFCLCCYPIFPSCCVLFVSAAFLPTDPVAINFYPLFMRFICICCPSIPSAVFLQCFTFLY